MWFGFSICWVPASHALFSHFFNVNLQQIRINGSDIKALLRSYVKGHFIVDSGTTDSYLPSSMQIPFTKTFKEVTGLDYQTSGSSCKGYTEDQLSLMPDIQFVLESIEDGDGMVLNVTPAQYLVRENGKYCGNIFLSETSGGGTLRNRLRLPTHLTNSYLCISDRCQYHDWTGCDL